MQFEPRDGDLQAIRTRPGVIRRRVGVWRIFFTISDGERRVEVLDVVRRTSKTY